MGRTFVNATINGPDRTKEHKVSGGYRLDLHGTAIRGDRGTGADHDTAWQGKSSHSHRYR